MNAGVADLAAHLAAFPAEIRELIDDRDDHDLRRAAAGGGWGPVEVFCHLRDLDALFVERIERILREDEPYFQEDDETLWPIERDYASQDPRRALDEFAANRARYVALLEGLTPGDLDRRAHHEVRGDQTALWYVLHSVEHDAVHRQQLIAALGEP